MPRTTYRHDNATGSAWLKAVGERLQWAREIAADSQTAGAKVLGCDQSTMSAYENGNRLVPLRVALNACAQWGLTLDYLYRGSLSSDVRQDMAVRLAAAHPELVDAPAVQDRRAKAKDRVAS